MLNMITFGRSFQNNSTQTLHNNYDENDKIERQKIEIENLKKHIDSIKTENVNLKKQINYQKEQIDSLIYLCTNEIKKKEINTDVILSKEKGFLTTSYEDLEKVFFKLKKERAEKKVNVDILFSKAKTYEYNQKPMYRPNGKFYSAHSDPTPDFKPTNVRYPQYDTGQITIILEGPIRYCNIFKTVDSYKHLCREIILSSYVTEEEERELKKIASNIVILNHDPHIVEKETRLLYPPAKHLLHRKIPKKGFQQFYHMKKALPLVKTAFVLKARTDQAYSNLDIAIKLMYSNDDKVVMWPYYIRGYVTCRYHGADMLFGCTTKKMKEIWLNYHEINVANQLIEIAIWTGWMNAEAKRLGYHDPRTLSPHDYGEFCSKLFLVLNESKHTPYKMGGHLNRPSCRRKYIYDEKESTAKNTYNYFSGNGCDLGFGPQNKAQLNNFN